MNKKLTALSALAVLTAQAGIATSASAQEAVDLEEVCEIYRQIDDRTVLQQELSLLLQNDPSNQCIDVIVSLLGGGPVAQVPPIAIY